MRPKSRALRRWPDCGRITLGRHVVGHGVAFAAFTRGGLRHGRAAGSSNATRATVCGADFSARRATMSPITSGVPMACRGNVVRPIVFPLQGLAAFDLGDRTIQRLFTEAIVEAVLGGAAVQITVLATVRQTNRY